MPLDYQGLALLSGKKVPANKRGRHSRGWPNIITG